MDKLHRQNTLIKAIYSKDTLTAFVAAENGVTATCRNINSSWYAENGVQYTDDWSALMLVIACRDSHLSQAFIKNLNSNNTSEQELHLLADLAEIYDQDHIRKQLLQITK